MDDLRKGCPMRHENGNCTVIGGFCTAVNDPICEGLHNAYDSGYRTAAIHVQQDRENQEQITNADRIRSMNDEELADFIDRCEMGDIDYAKTFCDLCNGQYECDKCRLDWLQQPAEGE